MWSLFLLSLGPLLPTPCLARSEPTLNYFLGYDFFPRHYNIELTLDNDFITKKTFSGITEITIIRKHNASILRLHAGEELRFSSMHINGHQLNITNVLPNGASQIMELPVNKSIGKTFVVRFQYKGSFALDMAGFYLSREDNSAFLATTHFQPSHARRAFPCFDEPIFKATFALTIAVPLGYNVVSNQAATTWKSHRYNKRALYKREFTNNVNFSSLQVFKFPATPPMSPYLLAFVISKFVPKQVPNNYVQMSIWASNGSIASTETAAKVSYKILENLSNLLNQGSSNNVAFDQMGITHFDQIAIPDFLAGAMENWGLVTYKQSKLLWNNTESTLTAKEELMRVIAHEFAHSWFGNWVTTKWWNTTWLNEGFARYFEYHGLVGVFAAKEFEPKNQFVINEIFPVMVTDGSGNELALTSDVYTCDEIKAKFGMITYSKGATIIRMLNFLTGKDFYKSLNDYIEKYKGDVVIPNNLLDRFPQIQGESIAVIMGDWFNKPGYPVVNVAISETNATHRVIILTQTQFFYNKPNSPIESSTEWYIPIWYMIVNSTDNFNGPHFLQPGTQLTLTLLNNQIIIINPQRISYLRVNYEEQMWQEIADILKMKPSLIDEVTRAHLVDDVLNLARAGQLSYELAFEVLDYLKQERSYYPWKAAVAGFEFLRKRMSDSLWVQFSRKIIGLMKNYFDSNEGFHIEESMTPLQVYAKVLALQWSCLLEQEVCIEEAQIKLEEMIDLESINANLRHTIYCTALRHPSAPEDQVKYFNLLFEQYQSNTVANAKEVILSALGCATNATLVRHFLDLSLNISIIRQHDGINVFKAVLNGNTNATKSAIDFLDEKCKDISMEYMRKALPFLGDHLKTEEELTYFQKFVYKHRGDLKGNFEVAEVAIARAKSNVDWMERNKWKFGKFLTSRADRIMDYYSCLVFVLVLCLKVYNIA